jgi:glycerate kinase
MKIVIAPDKFKGSLSAAQAASAITRGVRKAAPDAIVDSAPMADGGEGTVDALVAATSGSIRTAIVAGPLGERVTATYGILGDGSTAVIEMAAAAGLVLVPKDRRDPAKTTTIGVGELILDAVQNGAQRVIVGIGGSATNDGGAGLAQALGYRLLDEKDEPIEPAGGTLDRLAKIEISLRSRALDRIQIDIACDVDNPLCGPEGASAIYGPQKGASPAQVELLDRNLAHFAAIIERDLGVAIRDLPGAGAAGGLGAGLVAFAHGRLKRGIDLIVDAVHLADRLQGASLCLTAEGSLDRSSAFGKTVVGVSKIAKRDNIPVIALAGTIGPGAEDVIEAGIDAYFSVCPGPITLDEAVKNAAELLEHAAEHALRAFLAGRRGR